MTMGEMRCTHNCRPLLPGATMELTEEKSRVASLAWTSLTWGFIGRKRHIPGFILIARPDKETIDVHSLQEHILRRDDVTYLCCVEICRLFVRVARVGFIWASVPRVGCHRQEFNVKIQAPAFFPTSTLPLILIAFHGFINNAVAEY